MSNRVHIPEKAQQATAAHTGAPRTPTYASGFESMVGYGETAAHSSGFAHDFSQIPARAAAPVTLQRKIAVGSPGDVYEQEADQVADRVMSMSEPARLGACADCAAGTSSEPKVRKQPERVSAKHVDSGYSGTVDAPAGVQDVLSSSGQPLDGASRKFFEPRFGHDFSRVRVHTDATAQRSAREVGANAYTVGHHIAFAPGRFAPQSTQGRHLLAHELTHVMQQSGSSASAPLLQRDIGAEFQLRNKLKTNTGRTFGRKEGKFFHRVPAGDKHGLELQAENRSVMEFETHHFQKFSDLRKQVQDAVDVVNDIKKDPKAFAFNQEARLRKEGVLKKGETIEVEVTDSAFNAAIQTTEGIALSQYSSLLKEHESNRPVFVDPVLADAQSILTAAMAASKSVKAGANVDNLRGFLQIILNYVRKGQRVLWNKSNQEAVKATFRLMMRTNFALMFSQILTKDERALFRDIVKTDAIPKAVGIAAADPFFKTGYWGDLGGQHALFEHGKVTALNNKGVVHDCSSATRTPGVDSSQCGATIAGTDITVGGWLKSIVAGKQDLLSPAAHGSGSMGQLSVSKKPAEKDLAVIEVRGTAARTRTQPASKWVDYIDEVFSQAATCRGRAGKTNLNYDGSNPFNPVNCP